MKKFIQYTAVLGSVLAVLGFGTASAAHVQGGRWSQMRVWKDAIHNRREHDYHIPAAADMGVVLEEGVKSFSCPQVFSMEIDCGNVTVSPGDTQEIIVRCDSAADFGQVVWAYTKDEEMKLAVYGRQTENRKPNVQVTVPADFRFQEMEIELGTGSCTIAEITTLDFSGKTAGGDLLVEEGETASAYLCSAAGSISWNGQASEIVDIDCAAGSVSYYGQIFGDVEAGCAAGNINLKLPWQKETDFNYELQGTGGSIQVGNHSYSGMLFTREDYHGASWTMELQSAAGSIQAEFGNGEISIEEVEELPFTEIEIEDTCVEEGDKEHEHR